MKSVNVSHFSKKEKKCRNESVQPNNIKQTKQYRVRYSNTNKYDLEHNMNMCPKIHSSSRRVNFPSLELLCPMLDSYYRFREEGQLAAD